MMTFERISLDKYSEAFLNTTGKTLDDRYLRSDHCQELSSVTLGGKVISVSDEFFAEAFHLILVEVSFCAKISPTSCSASINGRPRQV
jgi:allantoicase